MLNTIKTLSPGTKAEDLQYILDRVDVDSYFDYLAIEMFFPKMKCQGSLSIYVQLRNFISHKYHFS